MKDAWYVVFLSKMKKREGGYFICFFQEDVLAGKYKAAMPRKRYESINRLHLQLRRACRTYKASGTRYVVGIQCVANIPPSTNNGTTYLKPSKTVTISRSRVTTNSTTNLAHGKAVAISRSCVERTLYIRDYCCSYTLRAVPERNVLSARRKPDGRLILPHLSEVKVFPQIVPRNDGSWWPSNLQQVINNRFQERLLRCGLFRLSVESR